MIRNKRTLVANASSPAGRRARILALGALEAALDSVDPYDLTRRKVRLSGENLHFGGIRLNLNQIDRVVVLGAGKASVPMLGALLRVLGKRVSDGIVCVPRGSSGELRSGNVAIVESSHPDPDVAGLRAARRMEKIAQGLHRRDLAICLFSGGASTMLPAPKPGLPLTAKREIARRLMRAGATIGELNCVRKHLSTLKGGQLAALLYPARVVALLLSDVVGDDPATIASGPTAPDPTTYSDAIRILRKYDLWNRAPGPIREILTQGKRGRMEETPKPRNRVFGRVHNIIIGGNEIACKAAVKYLRSKRVDALHQTSMLQGEAREVGEHLASLANRLRDSVQRTGKARALVTGGETTVSVVGGGRGGRNQELALAACQRIRNSESLAMAFFATDGSDGPTNAAGAIVDGHTMDRARRRHLDADDFLSRNDSYHFFAQLNDLIMTGPTGSNVSDVHVIVAL